MYAIDAGELLKKVQVLQSLDGWAVIHRHDVMIAPVLDVVPTAELTTAHARIAELEAEVKRLEFMLDSAKNVAINRGREVDRFQSHDKEAMELLEAAIADTCGYCTTCAFADDCSRHDNNDTGVYTWYYGDCDEWRWQHADKMEALNE